MPTQGERRKGRKFTRTPGAKTAMHFFKGKSSKKTCAICDKALSGVASGKRRYGVSKLSKSQKRPERIFGGVLCRGCCSEIIEETAKVKTGVKSLHDVSFAERKYVEMAFAKVGE